jgi:hypothetical protein
MHDVTAQMPLTQPNISGTLLESTDRRHQSSDISWHRTPFLGRFGFFGALTESVPGILHLQMTDN